LGGGGGGEAEGFGGLGRVGWFGGLGKGEGKVQGWRYEGTGACLDVCHLDDGGGTGYGKAFCIVGRSSA